MAEEDEGESREWGWARVVRLVAGVSARSVGGGLERFMHEGELVERERAGDDQLSRVGDASRRSSPTLARTGRGGTGTG